MFKVGYTVVDVTVLQICQRKIYQNSVNGFDTFQFDAGVGLCRLE